MDNSEIVDFLVATVQGFEGCRLVAYPDPIWTKIKRTESNWAAWGKPWTIGWGETKGIKEGDVWTQEYADSVLRKRVVYFMLKVYANCPQLHLEPPGRIVASTSFAYNTGIDAYKNSSVCRRTKEQQFQRAADAFLLWNKAGGKVLRGLTLRRQAERTIYLG